MQIRENSEFSRQCGLNKKVEGLCENVEEKTYLNQINFVESKEILRFYFRVCSISICSVFTAFLYFLNRIKIRRSSSTCVEMSEFSEALFRSIPLAVV